MISRSPERENLDGGSFESAFGVAVREEINGEIEKVLPSFTRNGLNRKEKDFLRATLFHRILGNSGVSTMERGRKRTSIMLGRLRSRVERLQGDLYNQLAIDTNGEKRLPAKLDEKVRRVINAWVRDN